MPTIRSASWIEPHYRTALQAMERAEPATVTITRLKPLTDKGKPTRTIKDGDTITFAAPVALP